MSNIEKVDVAVDVVRSSEHQFRKLAEIHGAVDWEREASYAVQILKNNNYLAGIAYNNPDSLRDAVLNVASIGLSLNSVRALAYLVPRDGKVMLDISYKGFLQLAIDSGAIEWARCELVYEEDTFVYNGAGERPTHGFNPFSMERGQLLGCYCVVKIKGGDYLTDMMPIKEIYEIRNRSKAWIASKKRGGNCPWVTDEGEMIKKTVIRRAFKMWPIPSESAKRLDSAMEATFADHELDITPMTGAKLELVDSANSKLEMLGKKSDSEQFITYLSRAFNRQVDGLDSLTEYELKKLHAMLDQWLAMKPKEETNELELEEIDDEESTGHNEAVSELQE